MNQEGNYQWNEHYPIEADFFKDIDNGDLYVAVDLDHSIVGFSGNSNIFLEVIFELAITTDQPKEYSEVGLDIQEMAIVPHRLAVVPQVIIHDYSFILLNFLYYIYYDM